MIPQRHLSLLGIRLHKQHGGRRIPEAVLKRDPCLALFLIGLSKSKLRNLLIFKGGTPLKRCHFGDYHSSEDLDFTLTRRVEFAEIAAGFEEVYKLVAQASDVRFSFEAEDRQTQVDSYTFYLRYRTSSRWTSRSRNSFTGGFPIPPAPPEPPCPPKPPCELAVSTDAAMTLPPIPPGRPCPPRPPFPSAPMPPVPTGRRGVIGDHTLRSLFDLPLLRLVFPQK